MTQAESLIIWFLVGTLAFFVVGLIWATVAFFEKFHLAREALAPIDRAGIEGERDARINRSLIARYDLVDRLVQVAEDKGENNMGEQVSLLRDDFLFMMKEFSLTPFEFNKGHRLTIEDRQKIILVDQKDGSNAVVETVSCGFEYETEDGEPKVARKAAVKLG